MAVPSRGLNNIQTLSGRVDQLSVRYRVYMQITCLEMEKARRESERRSANLRLTQIDTRLRQIEIEKDKLLRAIDGNAAERGEPLPKMKVQAPVKRNGGFKIRY